MILELTGNVIFKHVNYPDCDSCDQAEEIFKENNTPYAKIISEKKIFGKLMSITKDQSVPQILINGEYIGGVEDLKNYFRNKGEWDERYEDPTYSI